VVAEGVEHGVGDLLREQAVHHLVLAVVAHLGHHRLVAFDAVGDAVGEVQLVVVADLGAVEVVEPVDDLGQALLLGVKGLA
jgi:hypothetical protein